MTSTAFPRTAASYSAMAVSVLAVIGRGQGRARSPATAMDGRCSGSAILRPVDRVDQHLAPVRVVDGAGLMRIEEFVAKNRAAFV